MVHLAATTGPLCMYIGLAVYEDERFPEQWIFAQKGEEELKSLVPGKSGAPEGSTKVTLGADLGSARSEADRLYAKALNFAPKRKWNGARAKFSFVAKIWCLNPREWRTLRLSWTLRPDSI